MDAHAGTRVEQAKGSQILALSAVFVVSGLIYESNWSPYLKLFVGHAAYAQTVVLVVFIGGIALLYFLNYIGTDAERFLASLAPRLRHREQRSRWLRMLAALARAGRAQQATAR